MKGEGRITMILHAKSFHNKDKIQRAKIGLQLFLSILIITSIILNVGVIITESRALIVVYMFTPALSSILTRIILKEGFKDVSFSLGNLKIWKGIGFALLIPMIICGITYSIAWLSGIAGFQYPEGGMMLEPIYNMLGLQYVTAPFSFIYLVVLSGIFGSLLNLIPVLGEEMGWRGYMLTRLVDAEFSRPILIEWIDLGNVACSNSYCWSICSGTICRSFSTWYLSLYCTIWLYYSLFTTYHR